MSLTTVPVSLIDFRSANTSANTLNGANVVFVGNTAYSTGMGRYQRRAGLMRGRFRNYIAPTPVPAGYVSGSSYGYDVGGNAAPDALGGGINRYPFSSDTNATDVGQIGTPSPSINLWEGTGTCSATYGYVAGGLFINAVGNDIRRFPFSSPEGTMVDVGQLTATTRLCCGGISDLANDRGFNVGDVTDKTMMNRYPTVSPGNATDVANLATPRYWGAGSSSETDGYVIGGETPADIDVIEKFPFASNASSNQPATLLAVNRSQHGHQSASHVYVSGGISNADVIQKFAYAADSPATDVGDLVNPVSMHGGTSSQSHGYVTAGYSPNVRIEKFSMISDGNGTSVGDLPGSARYRTQGNIQV